VVIPPNNTNLTKGEMAFGKVPGSGKIKLFVNDNNTVTELPLANGGDFSLSGDVTATAVALGSLAAKSTITSADITDGTIVNADISASAAIVVSKISGLAAVATSGSYNDLSDIPIIEVVVPEI
jgi:hypothetical protein